MLKQLIPFIINTIAIFSPKLAAKIAIELFSRPNRFDRNEEEQALFKQARQIHFASGQIANEWSSDFEQALPIVFLCHGWESRATAFHKLIPALIANKFHVIAWNAPAHGASPGNNTNLYKMSRALLEDLEQSKIKPVAFVGHSMGGAIFGLLNKSISLPKSIVIMSAPTDINGIFNRYFSLLRLNPKAQTLVLEHINNLDNFTLDDISLINSDIYQDRSIMVIHDKTDKEIPYSDFERLETKWSDAIFYPTEGLGHRRILRDTSLANTITEHILQTYK